MTTYSERNNRVKEAVLDYNRHRVPEVEAEILRIEECSFKIRFRGSFCMTCGFYDYFDDLMYNLLDIFHVETEIGKVEEQKEGAIVVYRFI